ncbi:MAG TPA: hypothetical protein VJ987_05200 [Anaerolineales bacterium]|nr:hypothetical protein [Anaerolineales bacterium]
MYKFWLQLDKPEEKELSQKLEAIRKQRKFAPTMRTALHLFFSLMEGRTDVILDLFPWIKDVLQDTSEHPNSSNKNSITIAIKDDTYALRAHIERLEQLIIDQGSKPISQGETLRKALPALKQYIEPELEIKKTKSDDRNNSSYNFMIASAMQIYGNYDALPPEIIDYGLETGRIPKDKVKAAKLPKKADPPETIATGNPKQLAGATATFEAPEIDLDAIQI